MRKKKMSKEYEMDFKKTADFFDKFASEYYESRVVLGGRLFNEYIEMPAILSLIPQKISSKKALDIGCGIGVYSRVLAEKGAKVTAIDVSSKMLEVAKKLCSDFDVDFKNIPFQDYENTHKFDLIIGGFMLGLFYDLTNDFKKISSLMNSTGSCILSTIHPVKLGSVSQGNGTYSLDDYYDKNSMYKSDSMGVSLKKWNFTDISDAAYKAGLYIDKILEPKPLNPPSNFDKLLIDFYNRCPSIVVIELKKRKNNVY